MTCQQGKFSRVVHPTGVPSRLTSGKLERSRACSLCSIERFGSQHGGSCLTALDPRPWWRGLVYPAIFVSSSTHVPGLSTWLVSFRGQRQTAEVCSSEQVPPAGSYPTGFSSHVPRTVVTLSGLDSVDDDALVRSDKREPLDILGAL